MLTFTASAAFAALRRVSRWRPDVSIAFFGIPSGPIAYMLKALHRVPYIVSLRGGDVPGFHPYHLAQYHRLMGPVIRLLWRQAAFVVSNSQGLSTLARHWAPDIVVKTIPNGVDAKKFQVSKKHRKNGRVRMVFVGRLTHQKGIDIFLRALHRLDGGVPVEAELVGDGGARLDLQNLVKQLGLENRVHFEGWSSREDVLAYYQGADIFVMPSRDEGMPNALLEAMACGLPVIATRVSGNEELVQDGVTGLLVPPDDPCALGKALERLVKNEDLRRMMGKAGRGSAERIYTWRLTARAYLALCETFAGDELVCNL
jgi:glycosyltransferase involved in cell wall biosynthesis